MAIYSPPPHWQHGDQPTAGAMNLYSQDIISIYGVYGPVSFNVAIRSIRLEEFELRGPEYYTFLHRYRWLHYLGDGEISSMDGTNTNNLADTAGAVKVFDMTTVDWLAYGELYKVSGLTFACEVQDNGEPAQTSGE